MGITITVLTSVSITASEQRTFGQRTSGVTHTIKAPMSKSGVMESAAIASRGQTPVRHVGRLSEPSMERVLLAARKNSAEILREESDADLRRHFGPGAVTPLMASAGAGATTVVEYLVAERQVPIEDRSSDGKAALHFACMNGHLGVTKVLLQAGADPNGRDALGMTPLMYAVAANSPESLELVEALLAHRADPNLTDHAGKRAKDFVVHRKGVSVPGLGKLGFYSNVSKNHPILLLLERVTR
jgi:hypothetical protein